MTNILKSRPLLRLSMVRSLQGVVVGLAPISFSLGFMEGVDERPKSAVFVSLLKVGHIVKLGFLFELQVF